MERRFLLLFAGSFGILAASSSPAPTISEADVLAYASAPYDRVEAEKITLGAINGNRVVAEFICSDVCPDYTVRVIHYELRPDQTCSSVGGLERAVRIPVAIAAMDKVFCFPKVLIHNWHKYQRKMSSVPSHVGPHE